MENNQIKNVVEAVLMAAGRPLSLEQLVEVFGIEAPDRGEVIAAIEALQQDYAERGIMIAEVASGYRVQVRTSMTEWVSRLWDERPPRYSRALMETLALVAYRQPITRGEIEDIRGVSVSSNIVRTLSERGWIRVVGHRDVPGKPAMYGTTREFLDYFGLRRLDELPPLSELRDLDSLNVELDLGTDGPGPSAAARESESGDADGSAVAEFAAADDGVDAAVLSSGTSDVPVQAGASALPGDAGAPGDDSPPDEAISDDEDTEATDERPRATVVPLKKPGSM